MRLNRETVEWHVDGIAIVGDFGGVVSLDVSHIPRVLRGGEIWNSKATQIRTIVLSQGFDDVETLKRVGASGADLVVGAIEGDGVRGVARPGQVLEVADDLNDLSG